MSKDKNTRLVTALNTMADLAGQRQVIGNNEIGLGMILQSYRCREEAQMVTDGLFRIVVMGTFTSGRVLSSMPC